MISVICPYHNSTDFIANAINGLLSQKVQKGSFEEFGDFILFDTWQDIAYWFSGFSIVSIILMRLILKLRKKDRIDINEY